MNELEAIAGLPDIGIPAEVLFHPDLTPIEKILFGLIRNLSHSPRGCWASNRYLGDMLRVGPQTISNGVSKLRDLGFFKVILTTVGSSMEVNRQIFIDTNYLRRYQNQADPLLNNLYTPIINLMGVYKKSYKKEDSEKDKDIKTSSSNGGFQIPSTSTIPSKRTKPPIDHQAIIDAWNKAVDGTAIPKVIKSTSKRIAHIRARMEDLPTIEDWRQLFDKVKSSPFLRGENDRGWTADFDWVVGNDTNFVKVLEGKYKPTTLSQPIKKASQERGCRNLELSDEKRQFYRNGGDCVDFTPNLKGH